MGKKRKIELTELYTIPADLDDAMPTVARVDNISKDGRRITRQHHLCYAPSANTPNESVSHGYDEPLFGIDTDTATYEDPSAGSAPDGAHTEQARGFVTQVSS